MSSSRSTRTRRLSPAVAGFLSDRIRSASLTAVAELGGMDAGVLARAVAGDAVLAGTELRVVTLATALGYAPTVAA